MNYKFASPRPDPNRVVLVRSRMMQIVLSVILFLVAIATLPAGLLLLLGDTDPYRPYFLTGMGLLFLFGGIALNTMLKIPGSLIFDNVRGALLVNEGKGRNAQQALIPYAEIESFQVRPHRQGKSTAYVAEMLKKDGAFWTLFSSGSQSKAGAFCETLKERASLRESSALAEQPAPACVTMEESGDSTIIGWKNRYSIKNYLTTFILIGSMAMLMYGSRPYATSTTAYYAGLAFISFIILFAIASMLNSIGRAHRVEIGRGLLSYRKTGGLFRTGEFSIPLAEIDSILFNFSLTSAETAIYVLTAGEKDMLQSIKRGAYGPADILNTVRAIKNARKLDIGPLSMSDRLGLESILQQAVMSKTGETGHAL
jgi:hypothetical protein